MMLRMKSRYEFPDIREILLARDSLVANGCYGPFQLWCPRSFWAENNLDSDYIPAGCDPSIHMATYTVRRRIESIDLLEKIVHVDNMRDHRLLLLSPGSHMAVEIVCNASMSRQREKGDKT